MERRAMGNLAPMQGYEGLPLPTLSIQLLGTQEVSMTMLIGA